MFEDFSADKFVLNQEPFIEELPFTGVGGPKHQLNPGNAVSFDYFCLFIPTYFWSLWAQYTNAFLKTLQWKGPRLKREADFGSQHVQLR
jgi:hypothetical protein